MSDVQLDLAAQKVCSWLSVCAKYANAKCGINQHIYIYLGGHKKRFPKSTITTIGMSNVNSGFKAYVSIQMRSLFTGRRIGSRPSFMRHSVHLGLSLMKTTNAS